ncbi:MAG: phosphotransferase [Rhodoferax sp.]|jgi:hypothetical protein|nr:phosphotransferase [Rhodoferax sp.]
MSACPDPSPAATSPTGSETPSPFLWSDPLRAGHFERWLAAQQAAQGLDLASLRMASADASFRRYFRIDSTHGSRIIMDAPPDKEDCAPFAHGAEVLAQAGLRVPQVLAWDRSQGFMLLQDLGPRTMMQALQVEQPQANLALYQQAIDALVLLQKASRPGVLPAFDRDTMLREMELFPQWYLTQHRGRAPDAAMRATLDTSFHAIADACLAWPTVFVHCDFMPRNLMLPVAGDPRVGVLDFQDALYGPITYDIGSLMRDAFLSWDEEFVLDITIRYWEKARAAGLPVGDDFGNFYRGVEWTGLQRHLRVTGIFARLTLRDGKPRYLADTPRFIAYMRATAARYRELKPLLRLLDQVEGIQEAGGYAFGRV